MPLVQAKCTNCGANIQVDDAKEAAICEYCGTPFIVEKAVNNYHTTNNIQADTVNIFSGGKPDFEIVGGVLRAYNGASTIVNIPDGVKEIGASAFENCGKIESINIPDGVTTIAEYAFQECRSLRSINLPGSIIEIGRYAFNSCSGLRNISIPQSVEWIGAGAFSWCLLKEIVFPAGIDEICDSVCEGCILLEKVNIPKGVLRIGKNAFSGCGALKSVSIPNTVTEIDDLAFALCGELKSITIPDSVTSIGTGALSSCNINNINASKEWKRMHRKDLALGASTGSGGGCYVATAVYGTYDCPQVWTLRRYRDYTLARTWYGRAFIRTYYAISPTLVEWFGQKGWFKTMWRGKLDSMVASLQKKGVESTPYRDRNW